MQDQNVPVSDKSLLPLLFTCPFEMGFFSKLFAYLAKRHFTSSSEAKFVGLFPFKTLGININTSLEQKYFLLRFYHHHQLLNIINYYYLSSITSIGIIIIIIIINIINCNSRYYHI